MKIIGLDLAGSEKRYTGFCFLNDKMIADTCIFNTDEEIIRKIEEIEPDVIAIDAPLALPKGRKSFEQRNDIHLRECDKELLKMKIKFFPITLGPMRKLTERGIKLKKILENKGFEVIETYPGAAQDILKIARKQNGLIKLKTDLERLGIKGLNDSMNGDELDAVTCALVGKMY